MVDPLKLYLAHSYIYYCLCDNIISDSEFDKLCDEINRKWKTLDSSYKDFLVSRNKCEAGYNPMLRGTELLPDQYPKEIIKYASELIEAKDGG